MPLKPGCYKIYSSGTPGSKSSTQRVPGWSHDEPGDQFYLQGQRKLLSDQALLYSESGIGSKISQAFRLVMLLSSIFWWTTMNFNIDELLPLVYIIGVPNYSELLIFNTAKSYPSPQPLAPGSETQLYLSLLLWLISVVKPQFLIKLYISIFPFLKDALRLTVIFYLGCSAGMNQCPYQMHLLSL